MLGLLFAGFFIAVGGAFWGEESVVVARQEVGATPAYGQTGVSSQILAHASPVAVADPELSLARVTLDPGAVIPLHEHPGTQLATILAGELTYSVMTGTIMLVGADGSDLEIPNGDTVTLRAGDAVIEQPGSLHQARNDGTEQVVISIAALFPAGAPRTSYAEATPTA